MVHPTPTAFSAFFLSSPTPHHIECWYLIPSFATCYLLSPPRKRWCPLLTKPTGLCHTLEPLPQNHPKFSSPLSPLLAMVLWCHLCTMAPHCPIKALQLRLILILHSCPLTMRLRRNLFPNLLEKLDDHNLVVTTWRKSFQWYPSRGLLCIGGPALNVSLTYKYVYGLTTQGTALIHRKQVYLNLFIVMFVLPFHIEHPFLFPTGKR